MKKGKRIAIDIAEVAIFVALMVAASFISIPFYPVPLTFQTVVSVLAGLLLGRKKGTAAMLVYLFMGLVCFIPVFADHSLAGFAYALKPSFGYIIGFIFSAFTGGMIVSGKREYPLWRYVVAGVAAFFANYVIGIPYFTVIWHLLFGNTALGGAVVTYNLIYMPKDLILSILAGLLAKRVVPLIRKGGVKAPELAEQHKNKKSL
ncbi:MAG: biotin transporter BioY [Clostridia bacterium]|nr:biotin transporter BioY [Clostridia bacterium]